MMLRNPHGIKPKISKIQFPKTIPPSRCNPYAPKGTRPGKFLIPETSQKVNTDGIKQILKLSTEYANCIHYSL